MARTTEELHNEIERERQRVNQRFDELHNRVDTIARAQDKVTDLMQGDEAWSRKGFIKQMIELMAFMESYKDFDLKTMKDLMLFFKNIKRYLLWATGFIVGLAALLTAVGKLFGNIKQLFH